MSNSKDRETAKTARLAVGNLNENSPPVANPQQERGINIAVRLAGSQSNLARRIGVRPQTVQGWVEVGKPSPAGCRRIEKEFREKCTRAMLDPDLFGPIPE